MIGIWVLLALAALPLQPRLQQLAADESDAFQSRSAESTRVDELIRSRFPEGAETTAVVAYTRDTVIEPADEARIEADARAICEARAIRDLTRVTTTGEMPCGAFPENTAIGGVTAMARSDDGTTLLSTVQTRDDATDVVVSDVAAVRAVVPGPDADGLRAYVTGESGFAADQSAAFEGIDGTLLIVTVVVLAILLLAIYRSPIVALVPLLVVGIAYVVAAGLTFAFAYAGAFRVTGQATAILIVLMFGAGTDYCLLLVARYREDRPRRRSRCGVRAPHDHLGGRHRRRRDARPGARRLQRDALDGPGARDRDGGHGRGVPDVAAGRTRGASAGGPRAGRSVWPRIGRWYGRARAY